MPRARSASTTASARRPRGTGSLLVRRDQAGGEIWYGKWRSGDEQVKRRIGPKRDAVTGEGLTRTEAEAQLRGLMGTVRLRGNGGGRVTVAAGQLLLERLETKGRRRTTLATYESHIRVHLVPLHKDDAQRRRGPAFDLRARAARGLGRGEPCTLVDKPRAPPSDPDIRFLESEDIEALLRAVPDDDLAASSAGCTSRPR
jgi:hypothetical protein